MEDFRSSYGKMSTKTHPYRDEYTLIGFSKLV